MLVQIAAVLVHVVLRVTAETVASVVARVELAAHPLASFNVLLEFLVVHLLAFVAAVTGARLAHRYNYIQLFNSFRTASFESRLARRMSVLSSAKSRESPFALDISIFCLLLS